MQPCKLWTLHHDHYQELKSRDTGYLHWANALLEHEIVCINDRKLNFIMLTAEERYELMLKEEPEILQLIPLKHLATMLGVTPRHLSRIRGQF
jgi:hypothetical protein